MQTNDVTLRVGGPAGSGTKTIGAMFSKAMQRCGLWSYVTNDYPSLIRGGHNFVSVRVSDKKVWALGKDGIDILLALDKNSISPHADQMVQKGVVVYDSTIIKKDDVQTDRKDLRLFGIPLSAIAKEAGSHLYVNTAALGATFAILGMNLEMLNKLVKENFEDKGDEIINSNIEAAKKGYDHVNDLKKADFDVKIEPKEYKKDKILLNGNDACCIGGVKAGVRLVAEYPMSPSSSVLHWMAAHAVEQDIVVKHTESEIAAINYILGAGFAGVRSMTATSGGGFALMTEALGNGGLAEIPTVIVEVQRAGPSTGVPTYTDQSDLQFVLHASQGEFPRIVCMPGDVEEAFYETFNVFNMAELVQTPAIILLDKFLGESEQTVEAFKTEGLEVKRGKLQTDEQMANAKDFKRHELTKDGISPRCIPGQPNGIHVASSYEHDETGYTCEDPQNRIAQIDKRTRKMNAINPNLYQPAFYGDEKSPFLVVSWGSTKGVMMEVLKELEKENMPVKFMHIKYASPFATDTIKQALQSANKTLILECNSEGQMRNLIREKTGILIEKTYLKYDARPFEVQGIIDKIKELY